MIHVLDHVVRGCVLSFGCTSSSFVACQCQACPGSPTQRVNWSRDALEIGRRLRRHKPTVGATLGLGRTRKIGPPALEVGGSTALLGRLSLAGSHDILEHSRSGGRDSRSSAPQDKWVASSRSAPRAISPAPLNHHVSPRRPGSEVCWAARFGILSGLRPAARPRAMRRTCGEQHGPKAPNTCKRCSGACVCASMCDWC